MTDMQMPMQMTAATTNTNTKHNGKIDNNDKIEMCAGRFFCGGDGGNGGGGR